MAIYKWYLVEKEVLDFAKTLGIEFGFHIGFGVFSDVFVAKYKSIKIVVKIMAKDRVSDKTHKNESIVSNILKEKSHINVAKVLEFYPIDTLKQTWVVMEWTEGADMSKILSARRPVPFAEGLAKSYFKQLVSGLKFLHSLGIVHRDIKPSNILIGKCVDDRPQVLKYIDFGFSKLVSVEDDKAFCSSHLGTQIYSAPELMSNEIVSYDAFKTDVYSLAIVLYEMLFYQLPFGSADMGMDGPERHYILLRLKQNMIIRYPEAITVSESAKHLIESMICNDSDKRFRIEQIEASEWMRN